MLTIGCNECGRALLQINEFQEKPFQAYILCLDCLKAKTDDEHQIAENLKDFWKHNGCED